MPSPGSRKPSTPSDDGHVPDHGRPATKEGTRSSPTDVYVMFVGEDLVSSLFSASRQAPGSMPRRRDGITPPHDQDIQDRHRSSATMLTLAGIMQAIFNRPMGSPRSDLRRPFLIPRSACTSAETVVDDPSRSRQYGRRGNPRASTTVPARMGTRRGGYRAGCRSKQANLLAIRRDAWEEREMTAAPRAGRGKMWQTD